MELIRNRSLLSHQQKPQKRVRETRIVPDREADRGFLDKTETTRLAKKVKVSETKYPIQSLIENLEGNKYIYYEHENGISGINVRLKTYTHRPTPGHDDVEGIKEVVILKIDDEDKTNNKIMEVYLQNDGSYKFISECKWAMSREDFDQLMEILENLSFVKLSKPGRLVKESVPDEQLQKIKSMPKDLRHAYEDYSKSKGLTKETGNISAQKKETKDPEKFLVEKIPIENNFIHNNELEEGDVLSQVKISTYLYSPFLGDSVEKIKEISSMRLSMGEKNKLIKVILQNDGSYKFILLDNNGEDLFLPRKDFEQLMKTVEEILLSKNKDLEEINLMLKDVRDAYEDYSERHERTGKIDKPSIITSAAKKVKIHSKLVKGIVEDNLISALEIETYQTISGNEESSKIVISYLRKKGETRTPEKAIEIYLTEDGSYEFYTFKEGEYAFITDEDFEQIMDTLEKIRSSEERNEQNDPNPNSSKDLEKIKLISKEIPVYYEEYKEMLRQNNI